MSILIQGIEMPKDDEILCIEIKSNGCVYYNLDLSVNTIANATRVPPHGRLIDADELKAKQQEDADLFINAYTLMEKSRRDEALNAVANIVNAPTIIPADKEEHDGD